MTMNKYSPQSEGRISTCHPDIKKVFRKVLEKFDHAIECGWRGKEEQDKAVNSVPPRSKTPWPHSKHNASPSEAIDAMPYPYSYDDIEGRNGTAVQFRALIRCGMFIGYVLATADDMLERGEISATLTSGVDWDGDKNIAEEKFMDVPHFQRKI